MQGHWFRYGVVIGLLLLGGAAYVGIGDSHTPEARWPTSDTSFAVDRWTSGTEKVEVANGATFITRPFRGPNATTAELTIITRPNAKLFGTGAELPFVGSGYEVSPAPASLVPPAPGREGLIAQRASERWLIVYAYGERRGLLGNGMLGWTTAIVDGVLGRPNDYYKLYLMTRLVGVDELAGRESAQLADTLFPRIADWYRA